MKVILPMAGNGQRFFDDGYDLPKPLIDIKGKPMFKRVVDNLHLNGNVKLTCIVRQDHVDEYDIDKRIKEHYEETGSNLSKLLIENYDEEVKNFVQVCPKEMLDKLSNPISLIPVIKEVS